jgi:hypothetical protein
MSVTPFSTLLCVLFQQIKKCTYNGKGVGATHITVKLVHKLFRRCRYKPTVFAPSVGNNEITCFIFEAMRRNLIGTQIWDSCRAGNKEQTVDLL